MTRRLFQQSDRDPARARARLDIEVGDDAVAPLRRTHMVRAARLLLDPADQETEPLLTSRGDQNPSSPLARRLLQVNEMSGGDSAPFGAPRMQRALEVLQGCDERDKLSPVGGLRVADHETGRALHVFGSLLMGVEWNFTATFSLRAGGRAM